jgi:hypothetical protein
MGFEIQAPFYVLAEEGSSRASREGASRRWRRRSPPEGRTPAPAPGGRPAEPVKHRGGRLRRRRLFSRTTPGVAGMEDLPSTQHFSIAATDAPCSTPPTSSLPHWKQSFPGFMMLLGSNIPFTLRNAIVLAASLPKAISAHGPYGREKKAP